MTKLVAPDGGVSGVTVETADGGSRTYDRAKDGTITVDNPRDARQLRKEGFFDAAGASFAHVKGFPCECGFNSVFRVCSKCGKEN
jgi:hypothetical protein